MLLLLYILLDILTSYRRVVERKVMPRHFENIDRKFDPPFSTCASSTKKRFEEKNKYQSVIFSGTLDGSARSRPKRRSKFNIPKKRATRLSVPVREKQDDSAAVGIAAQRSKGRRRITMAVGWRASRRGPRAWTHEWARVAPRN